MRLSFRCRGFYILMHPERGRRWVVCANPAAVGKVNHLLLFGRPLKQPLPSRVCLWPLSGDAARTREADGLSSCLFLRTRG